MFFKSLKLTNIRSYVEETIVFPTGSTLLAGDIGAGKSTILLAIEFALFGTKRGQLQASSLLRNGAHAGRIDLTLSIQEKEIKISRTLKRTPKAIKQEAGYLVINNQRIDATPVELRAKIIELLGYPKDTITKTKDLIYRYTVFTPQEQMRQILYDTKEERMNTLRKVFNIDKYKKIKENARICAKDMRSKAKALKETITTLPTLIQEKQKTLIQKEALHQQLNTHKPILIELQQKTTGLQKQIEATEEKKKAAIEIEQRVAVNNAKKEKTLAQITQTEQKSKVLQEEITQLQQQTSTTIQKPEDTKEQIQKKIQEANTTLNETKQQLLLTKQKQETLQKQKEATSAAMHNIQQSLEQKALYEQQYTVLLEQSKGKEEIEKKITAHTNELQEITKLLAECNVQSRTATQTIERMQTLENCTLCLQDVTHEHKEQIISTQRVSIQKAASLQQEIEKKKTLLDEQLQTHNKNLKEVTIAEKKTAVLKSMLEQLRSKEKEMQQKEEEHKEIEKNITAVNETLQQLQATNMEETEKEIHQLQTLLEQIHKYEKKILERKNIESLLAEKTKMQQQLQVDMQQLLGQQQNLDQEQQQIIASLEQYKNITTLLAEQKTLLIQRQQQEKEQEHKILALEKDYEAVMQHFTTIQAQVQEKEATKKRIDALQLYSQWLDDFFANVIATMEKQVMLQVHTAFNDLFTKWFSIIMEDGAMSARLDELFSPIIEQNGYETEVQDLSGGEKTAVALAYRLALNKVINDFMTTIHTKDIIILDEPTDGFSSQQLDKVREVLDQLQMQQIILVSHESKVESFVQNVLRIHKSEHVSHVL